MDKLKRLIDANALPYENMVLCDDDWCLKVYEIERAPTIEAATVVHGMWEHLAMLADARCSICGYMQYKDTPFCPNCGAAMTEDNP